MQRALPILFGLALYTVFTAGDYARAESIAKSDHLIPAREIIPADYYRLLQRKLFVSPADFARVVDLPPFRQEAVVAIYTVRSRSEVDVRITYTRSDKVLWDVGSDSQGHFIRDPAVSVKRIDAPFPEELALAVSRAVERALRDLRPRPPPQPNDRVTVDGGFVEFSVSRGAQITRGLLTSDASGKKAQRLHHLKDLLERYCQSPADRTSVAQQIAIAAAKITREPVRTNGLTKRWSERLAAH
jgi:hypothetical protein